ncbi:ommochrome-binding protein-like [Aricia agestis]|uniref:ommochrome-binding protein-like n=1 Tax=Aricia agestis TaxID=91739 RepID=UPI001C207CEB|nr:ommochrome-binding protein-like [Aricia agestis]
MDYNREAIMRVWIIASLVALVISDDTTPIPTTTEPVIPCDTCVRVNQTCYDVNYLFDLEAPYRERIVISKLGILKSSNILYFSFEPKITDAEYQKVGFVHLDNPGNASIISSEKQLLNFGTFDIDQDNGMVYLGGSDGIYVLDSKINTIMPYSSRGDRVLSVFYKGHIYFVRDEEFKVVRKKGDNFDVLLEHMMIRNFVINKYNVIVYVCTYGLFASKHKETVWLSNNPFFRGLTIDMYGTVYAWWVDGIYKIDVGANIARSKITKVALIPDIGAVTFDNDNNIMFTSGKSLFRLTESNATYC